MTPLQTLIGNDIQIPTLPSIAVMILEAVRDEDSSLESLAKVVSSDPALAARVLKVTNSSLYGLRNKVSTIKQAISILGLNALKNIALSFVIVESFQDESDSDFNFSFFWKRAVTAAVAADMIARHMKHKNDEALVCGLLQDIGVVIFFLAKGQEYGCIFDEKKVNDAPIAVLEKKLFGIDHQEVGAAALDLWGLPASIVEPIRYHHCERGVPKEVAKHARILQLSDRISALCHGTHNGQTFTTIKSLLREMLNLGEDAAKSLLDQVAKESNDIISFFELPGTTIKPISQLLQEANSELAKLNFSYEHLALQYQWEKERALELAQALKSANEKLKSMAFRDELTGLFNQRYFLTSLENEFNRAIRYQRPFSLVLLDIDRFKKVNDELGHRAGSALIRIIGSALERVSRSTDLLARYGGDEFALICPETGVKAAAILAQRMCRTIEQLVIPMCGKKINITISLGVTGYEPASSINASAMLFDAADRALHLSKSNGRNQVTMLPYSD